MVLMSRDTETDCPENHHQKIVEEEMNELMHRLDCKTVEQVQEKLPKNVSGMPCQGEGVTVWIAHTQPGPFGWEISCLANSNFTRTEQ